MLAVSTSQPEPGMNGSRPRSLGLEAPSLQKGSPTGLPVGAMTLGHQDSPD